MAGLNLGPALAGPPPEPPKRGLLGNILDGVLLGGAIGKYRSAEYSRDLNTYERNATYDSSSAQLDAITKALAALRGDPQAASAASDPTASGTPADGVLGQLASPTDEGRRKAFAAMAILQGEPDKAQTILNQDVSQATDGTLYNKQTGQSIGRLPVRQVVNGFNTDLYAPKAPGYFPSLPTGVQPGPGGSAMNIPGITSAMAAQAAATKGAETAATTPYEFIDLPQPDGSTVRIPKAAALGLGGSGSLIGSRSQTPGDKAYAEDTSKAVSEQYQTMQKTAQQASVKIAKLQQIDTLLGDFEGGKYAPAGVEIASALNSLGYKMSPKMSNAQAADALSKMFALELRDPSSGGGLPGSMSDADREYLAKATPGLMQSAAGRHQLVGIQTSVLQRQRDVADLARKWQGRAGRLDKPDRNGKTFFDYLDIYANTHPLFGKH